MAGVLILKFVIFQYETNVVNTYYIRMNRVTGDPPPVEWSTVMVRNEEDHGCQGSVTGRRMLFDAQIGRRPAWRRIDSLRFRGVKRGRRTTPPADPAKKGATADGLRKRLPPHALKPDCKQGREEDGEPSGKQSIPEEATQARAGRGYAARCCDRPLARGRPRGRSSRYSQTAIAQLADQPSRDPETPLAMTSAGYGAIPSPTAAM